MPPKQASDSCLTSRPLRTHAFHKGFNSAAISFKFIIEPFKQAVLLPSSLVISNPVILTMFSLRLHPIDSQLPSLISLFIFVWSISETAVVSLYMGGLIVWRPSAQPKLAADHVSLWISPPLYMRMNLQCELGRCVHHNGGGVHFSVIFSEFACTKIGESVFLAKQR